MRCVKVMGYLYGGGLFDMRCVLVWRLPVWRWAICHEMCVGMEVSCIEVGYLI